MAEGALYPVLGGGSAPAAPYPKKPSSAKEACQRQTTEMDTPASRMIACGPNPSMHGPWTTKRINSSRDVPPSLWSGLSASFPVL